MNSENSKTSDSHRLLVKSLRQNKLEISDKYVALSKLSIYYTWKNIKKSFKNNKFKYYLRYGMKDLNYLKDHILYQIFKLTLNIS